MNIFLCHKCNKISEDKSINANNNKESNNLNEKEQNNINSSHNLFFSSKKFKKLNKASYKNPSQETELQIIDYPYNSKKESQNDFSKSTIKKYNFENDNILTIGHYGKPPKNIYTLLNLNNSNSVNNENNDFSKITNYDYLLIKKTQKNIYRKHNNIIKVNKTNNNNKILNKTIIHKFQKNKEFKIENNISYKKIIHYNYKNYNSNILFKSKDKNNNNNIRKASTLCLNNKNMGK